MDLITTVTRQEAIIKELRAEISEVKRTKAPSDGPHSNCCCKGMAPTSELAHRRISNVQGVDNVTKGMKGTQSSSSKRSPDDDSRSLERPLVGNHP